MRYSILIAATLFAAVSACGDSSDDDPQPGGMAGEGGAAGNAGQSGSSGNAGQGGASGTTGTGGSAGTSGAGGSSGAGAGGAGGTAGGDLDSGMTDASAPIDGALEGSCPAGFTAMAGLNTGFSSDDQDRNFHALVPDALDTPRPVFVGLTGTVQPEPDFLMQSGLDQLTDSGWIVLAPVRECSQAGTNCNMTGTDGRIWEPWFDGTTPASDDEGKDVRFVEAMVRCAAKAWPVDASRIYIGGISAGGSFTNRNLTFNSDFFAGGVVSSGNWYGGGAAPATPMPMDSSIVIIIWGGETDKWPLQNPIADYEPETKQQGIFYAAQDEVVTLACTGDHGHIWPADMTPWLAETLLAHPKGTAPSAFNLMQPGDGYSCVLGEYTDH